MRYPTAVASYSFHGLVDEGKFNVYAYLTALKYEYHVDSADIWTGLLPTLDDTFVDGVREDLDRKGLTLANLCVDGPHLWADTAEEREAHRAEMLRYLRAAERLGAKTVRVDFGGTEGHTMPEEAFEYIVRGYREYCEIAAGFGAKVGPENHWGWDRVPANLERVRDAVAMPNYGHLFHLGNFFDEPERGTEIAISYAMHTHISADMIPTCKPILARLAASGYEGVYSAEHHSAQHERERTLWQLGALRSILAELAEGDATGFGYVADRYAASK